MAVAETGKLALLWRGDRQARRSATPQNNRLNRVFDELAAFSISAEPAVYAEEMADAVREQLPTRLPVHPKVSSAAKTSRS
jgi:hypothetical protein